MKTPTRRGPGTATSLAVACALVASSLLASCALLGPRADQSRFFILNPIAAENPPSRGKPIASLGVGPIHFPSYLDRREIVTRVGPNEVRPAVFDYWAGSLPQQFATVLAENLQVLVGADRVQSYPWYRGTAPDLAVEVDVIRFEAWKEGPVELVARWRLRRGSEAKPLRTGETALKKPLGGAGPEAAAEALSQLLGDFSREVAKAIDAVRA